MYNTINDFPFQRNIWSHSGMIDSMFPTEFFTSSSLQRMNGIVTILSKIVNIQKTYHFVGVFSVKSLVLCNIFTIKQRFTSFSKC